MSTKGKGERPSKSGAKSGRTGVPQKHGGTLYPGSPPGGNRSPDGRTGRPPSAIRGSLRQKFDQSLKMLGDIADGVAVIRKVEECQECGHRNELDSKPIELKARDVLRAIDIAGKYGLGERRPAYDEELVDALGAVVGDVLAEELGVDEGARVGKRIAEAWVPILVQKRIGA